LIITCSPSAYNEAETLSTLRFGFRAKSIKNTPKINREFTVAELRILLERAEKTNADQEARIKFLESLLKENNILIPKENIPKTIETTDSIERTETVERFETNEEGTLGSDDDEDLQDKWDALKSDIEGNKEEAIFDMETRNDENTRVYSSSPYLNPIDKDLRKRT
jgi:hypothetical protein